MTYTAEMPSYTYARKAQRLLERGGFPSEIVRRESGCGFDLRLYSRNALKFLDQNSVTYRLKGSGGDSW
ncbi:MAG: hypothetical protein NC093_05540 [Alistipes sp.]|nr:hypothetical protein [Alistipes sp.]